jgi:tetratricopeptide (TPR) repeat protein
MNSRWPVLSAALPLVWGAAAAILGAVAPGVAHAQFTQQIILVAPFEAKDRRLAESISEGIRGRLQKTYPRREVRIIRGGEISALLDRSSIQAADIDTIVTRQIAKNLRADEIVYVTAERTGPRSVKASARLTLVRDQRLRQPLTPVEAPTPDSAAGLLALDLVASRRQLTPHRRCENNLREGKVVQAVAEGRAAVAEVPNGVLVRTCLVSSLAESGAPASEVWEHAKALLDLYPLSHQGLDAGARAADAMGEKDLAAGLWLRLAATDSADLALSRRVVANLLRGGNSLQAKPLIVKLAKDFPDDLEILRLNWQILYALKEFADAVPIGDRLHAEDAMSKSDSTFVQRLANAHKANKNIVRAIALAADGVTRFPKDPLLYLLYADLVQGDAKPSVDRGIERFPEVAEFHLMQAQELRKAGKSAEALQPFQRAMALDPTLGQGYLALAQTQVDVGQPDSAYVSVMKALQAGEPKGTVAQFALARGNALYKAANGTKVRTDYQLALRFLNLADSVSSSPESRFLVGATALAIGQSAATDAPTTKECATSKLAQEMLPLAREKITAGAQVAVDAARQYLAYLDQLEPVVAQQVATLCVGPTIP